MTPPSEAPPGSARSAIRRPLFIISPPRSGSTLLFESLARSPSLASIGGESHGVIEGIRRFHPAARGFASNRLTAADADPAAVEELCSRFLAHLKDRHGNPAAPSLRLLEKTPKNALRVPFLAAAFPDASFVYLRRDVRATLSSMIEAWQSGRFRTYPRLPGWPPPMAWSLLLVPGWRELAGRPLPEIVARQWATTVETALADLAALVPERVHALSYEHFVADPQAAMRRICASLDLVWDHSEATQLPASRHTLTAPSPDKWRRHEREIEGIWPLVAEADAAAEAFAQRFAIYS